MLDRNLTPKENKQFNIIIILSSICCVIAGFLLITNKLDIVWNLLNKIGNLFNDFGDFLFKPFVH